MNFLLLDKVFTIPEISGHFIFCLNEVHHKGLVDGRVGVGGKFIFHLVGLK